MERASVAMVLPSAALVACGEYKVRVEKKVAVPMRDAVVLKADVYRPGAPGTFPVIVGRTPYGKGHGFAAGHRV